CCASLLMLALIGERVVADIRPMLLSCGSIWLEEGGHGPVVRTMAGAGPCCRGCVVPCLSAAASGIKYTLPCTCMADGAHYLNGIPGGPGAPAGRGVEPCRRVRL